VLATFEHEYVHLFLIPVQTSKTYLPRPIIRSLRQMKAPMWKPEHGNNGGKEGGFRDAV
jgi:hypothetical protein